MTGSPDIYLDYNATAPLRPEAAASIAEVLAETGNASSVHGFGRRARRRVEDARDQVAALAGAAPADLVFTSGATEANNLALSAAAGRRAAVSAIEHDSVLATVPDAEHLPVTSDGRVDMAALDVWLDRLDGPGFLSIMAANNETGVIQPVAALSAHARARGADLLIHCDAVQAAGRLPLSLTGLGVDYLTLSAHKMGGPQGVGALLLAPGAPLTADRRGGGQERGRRAGTEPIAAIAGFGAAAAAASPDDWVAAAERRDRMEAALRAAAPDAVFPGGDAPRLPNTSCVLLPGVGSETQLMTFDLAGIAVSSGAACSSGKVAASHVLGAMGVAADDAACAIRISLAPDTPDADIDRFVAAWTELAERRRVAA